MFTKKIFGQRLQEVRKGHHETQPELGEAIGKNTTTIEKLAKICEHYKVSADYLLGLSDDPEPR